MAELPEADYALLDREGATATMFYPRPESFPPPEWAADHLIEVSDGVRLGARFYIDDPGYPTVLYFHGNGEIASDHDDISRLYHEIGLNLFVVEFRGYGYSTGDPTLGAMIADAHVAARHLVGLQGELGLSPRRFVMGRSLGAHAALELAGRASELFEGLIIESGAAGIRRTLERSGLLDTELGGMLAAAHEAKVKSIRLPSLLIHGERDDLIPLERAAELYDLLAETDRELVTIPNAGHNDLLWVGRDRYFEAISALVSRTGGQ